MCGVAGLIAKRVLPQSDLDRFVEAAKLMQHRGPDHTGLYQNNNVLLIHHRLSIIDLDPRANQPFTSQSGQSRCSFNGEIYNFQDIKRNLSMSWRTTSDTEVLLESFEKLGTDGVSQWNGIFAGLILQDNKLFAFRDRCGVKPLYKFENEDVILFSSEAKTILHWLSTFDIHYQALHQFIWFGNTTGNRTCVEGLHKLSPGSIQQIDLTTFRTIEKYYWKPESVALQSIAESTALEEIDQRLSAAVKRQLIADVPVGLLLSGGVDSGGLLAYASEHSASPIDTYTVDYDYNIGGTSELANAREIANRFGSNHHELRVTSGDVVSIFDKLVYQYDEPFADAANIPLYQLGQLCRGDKRVILQGDGGDELFGGYSRYRVMQKRHFWRIASLIHYALPRSRKKERIKRINHILSRSSDAEKIAYYLTVESPYRNPLNAFRPAIAQKMASQDWQADYRQLMTLVPERSLVDMLLLADFKILLTNRYLEKVDKATMACSVESRVPYLDNELVELALSLPASVKLAGRTGKYLLKKVLRKYLPDSILYGPKRGFDVPYRDWLRSDLFDYARNLFSTAPNDIFDRQQIEKLLLDHRARIADYGDLLWKLLVLVRWLDCYSSKVKFRVG